MKKKLKLNKKELEIVLTGLGKAKIPVIVRHDVPPDTIYFMSGEVPPQKWDNSNELTDEAPRGKVISRFLKRLHSRRIGKIVSLASQKPI